MKFQTPNISLVLNDPTFAERQIDTAKRARLRAASAIISAKATQRTSFLTEPTKTTKRKR